MRRTWILVGSAVVVAGLGARYWLAPRRTAARATEEQRGPGESRSAELSVTVKKPEAPEWTMVDRPEHFLSREPGKIVAMHRNGGRADPRFATIYLYVLPAKGGGDGAAEVAEMERLDRKAPAAEFKVEEERAVTVGDEPMTRRVAVWGAEGRATRVLSVRCVKGGKLYVLLAFADPSHFDAFLPDFEAVIKSLRIG